MLKKSVKLFSVLLAFVFFAIDASAAGIGVCTHISHGRDHDLTFKAASDVGTPWMRDEVLWQQVEPVKGEYQLPEYAKWVNTAKENGINSLVILAYGNPIYKAGVVTEEEIAEGTFPNCAIPVRDGNPATTDDDEYFDAYIKYVDFVSKELSGKVSAYEIWNEPDIKVFNSKDATAEDYAELLKAAYKTIKKNDPEAKVVGCALAIDKNFFDRVLKAGCGEYMDAVSFHYYMGTKSPEDGARKRMDEYYEVLKNNSITDMPLWVTETGWAISNVDELTQAKYILRNAVIFEDFLKDNNLTGQYFTYELHDSNTSGENLGGADYESSLGLIRHDYSLKISAKAVNIYNETTKDKNFESLDEIKHGVFLHKTVYCAKFNKENETTHVLWTNKNKDIRIKTSDSAVTVYDIKGNVKQTIPSNSTTEFTLTDEPIIIEYTGNEIEIKVITLYQKLIDFFACIFKK